ncbi:RING/U-box superfamily protein [Striga asiatica]|uniref:RBR-type E3 ubiquitin transferase n=1 Tax=Striga asiatica TaxID=4170 RepID=A0A5A7PEJ3_STRAF|nr:RING/U-box superfamily protein [Striga asiatica]
MVSVVTRPFSTFRWPLALKFPVSLRIPAQFGALITVYHQLSRFFRSESGASVISFVLKSASIFIAMTLPAWVLLCLDRRKRRSESIVPVAEVNHESPERMGFGPRDDDDETHFQEILLSSIFTPETPPHNPDQEPENPPQILCEICLEDKDSWQMFENEGCPHTFCYPCTSRHISTKIQEQAHHITCPAPNCKSVLTYDTCKFMIPNDTLVKWDRLLCISLIPEPHKLYCPFRDCSALLIYDSLEVIEQIRCLVCRRVFCGECRVPWHSEFSCREFQKLCKGKNKDNNKILKVLAKKKNWQKCPKCKMYVEKSEGCVHITCRCSYEFCYRCGGKWGESHGKCVTRRRWIPYLSNY